MAACLITTGGTNGTLRIDYLDVGGDPQIIFTSFGDIIYVDDTGSNYTYTRLTGNVTASSACVTITEKTQICYKMTWDREGGNQPTDYDIMFNAIQLGAMVNNFTPVTDRLIGLTDLILAVNNEIGNPNIQFVAGKATSLGNNRWKEELIIKIIDNSNAPMLRSVTPNGSYQFIIGVLSVDCIPSGFDPIITEIPS